MGSVVATKRHRQVVAANGGTVRTKHRISRILPDVGRDLIMHVATAEERTFAGLRSMEVSVLRSIWSTVVANGQPPGFGMRVTMQMFHKVPSALRFFDLTDAPWMDVKVNLRVKAHALLLEHFIGDVVDEASVSENVLQLARRVAERHVDVATRHPGVFFPDLWNAFAACSVNEILKTAYQTTPVSHSPVSHKDIECIWNILLLEVVQAMKRYFWRSHQIHDAQQAAILHTFLKTPEVAYQDNV